MPERGARLPKQFAADTKGGVAVIVAISVPVLLGFAALALEYGSGLATKSKNQGTSDIAAYAAAFEYNRNTSGNANERVAAARRAAEAVAALNGVSSGVAVSFNPEALYFEVTISEDRPVYLSRLLRPNDSLTISTLSRVALGEPVEGFNACILALGDGNSGGFTANGNSGTYNLEGCGVGSNGEMAVNGQTLKTSCEAAKFKGSACEDQTEKSGFTDPFSNLTNWPNDSGDDAICDFTGSLLNDLSTRVGGDDEYQLKEGVLCVNEFSKDFDAIFSNPEGNGNTLIFKAGVDFNMTGGKKELRVTPPKNGDFAGVAFYAPDSDLTVGGNAQFLINGLSCLGIVARSMTFNGNITLNAECSEDDANYAISGRGQPLLVQ